MNTVIKSSVQDAPLLDTMFEPLFRALKEAARPFVDPESARFDSIFLQVDFCRFAIGHSLYVIKIQHSHAVMRDA